MSIKDRNQNFWQLACIAGTAMGLPVMAVGGQLAKQYGTGSALISVFIGNFILWVMGLSIISMAQNRSHALQNIKEYLGKTTGFFAAIIWVSVFIIWYTLQIKASTNAFSNILPNYSALKIGVILGLLVAVIGIGGFRLIKWFSLVSLPLLTCLAIYAIFTSDKLASFDGNWEFSLASILPVILVWLGFGVNLPTFFRHSRSKQDSVIGLSLMTLFHIFLQTFTILVGFDDFARLDSVFQNSNPLLSWTTAVIFILCSYISVNLLNIYFASSAWEILIPKHLKSRNLLLIGILGTIMYVFLETHPIHAFSYSIEFFEKMSVSFIACLAIVLLIDFLIKIVVRHRPRPLEKFWSSLCWAIGCIASLIEQAQIESNPSEVVIVGIVTSTLGFLVIIFIEETIWSIKNLQLVNK